jgi:hypothetical protein
MLSVRSAAVLILIYTHLGRLALEDSSVSTRKAATNLDRDHRIGRE